MKAFSETGTTSTQVGRAIASELEASRPVDWIQIPQSTDRKYDGFWWARPPSRQGQIVPVESYVCCSVRYFRMLGSNAEMLADSATLESYRFARLTPPPAE